MIAKGLIKKKYAIVMYVIKTNEQLFSFSLHWKATSYLLAALFSSLRARQYPMCAVLSAVLLCTQQAHSILPYLFF